MKRLGVIVFGLLLALPAIVQAEELCTDGTLLFREDFGGNDPSDPAVGTIAVSGMSSAYDQIYKLQTSDPGTGMGAGCYLVAKRGYRNSSISTYSVWHIMDDHTYFGDTTRGYLLEIDGTGSGNDVFYSTVIDGLCAGSRLTFSAYVANLTTAGQYNAWRDRNYVHPKLSFVLTHPDTGEELARYNTDTISHDWNNYPKSWRETADWQLVGMNFTVPEEVNAVRLSIRNNASGSSTGNDFALDDIEIHLCMPPIHVNGVQEVCPGEAVTLGSELDYPYMVYESLYYKWWYSPDSVNWTEIDYGIDHFQLNIPDAGSSDSGWYKVAMGTEGRMDNDNCHTTSEPFRLTVKDCGTPEPPVTVTIVSPDSVCPNDPYTFEVNIENGEQLEEPVEYQWWYRSPEYPTVWNKVSGGNLRDLQISSFKTQHVGWYKVMVAGNGGINDEDKRVESEEYFVTFKKCEPDLCLDGTLLYRDDFGGNDPNDPRVGTDPVSGMAYSQSTNDRFGQMGNGRYIVTKTGYCNGDTAALRSQRGYVPDWGSQWILQDDHTYPDDRTRGYYVEIDGSGGNTPFYSTTIDGLCPGSKLTFSAYVVNVHFYEQVQKFYRVGGYNYVYPRMKFVLKNPQNGQTLATQSTGDIQPDVTKSWNIFLHESAEWQLVGMEFTVPEGVESIQMYIYNDVGYGTGNDFAMDDIEIHLCAPPVTIEGEPEFCVNETATLSADFTNDGTFEEPLVYKWWHSTDSVTWIEMTDFIGENPVINAVQKADSGWYKVAVAGNGNIENVNCRAVSEPFRLTVKECTPSAPDLCMDGILLFREDFGGNDPSDPRVGINPVPGMSYTQVTNDVFRSMGSGKYIVTKSGYCNGDTTGWSLPGADQSTYRSQWYIQDDHTYPNDYSRGYFMEIDGSGGNQQFYQTEISGLCEGIKLTFSAYVANVFTWFQYDWYTRNRGPVIAPCLKFVLTNPQTGETLVEKNTQQIPFAEDLAVKTDWQYSSPWYLVGMNFIVPTGIPAIRLTIYNNVTNGNGNDFALDDIEIHLCAPSVTIEGEPEFCVNETATLSADFTNDGTFEEPLVYKWWHSTDSVTWIEMTDFIGENPVINAVQKADSGWYKVAVAGNGNIENVNCRAVSEPFRLTVKECTPSAPDLCMDGILLFREDFGGNDPEDSKISTTPVSGMSYQQQTSDHLGAMQPGSYLVTKQGYQNGTGTSQWHIQDDHTHPGDYTRGYFMEIDGRSDNAAFYQTTIDHLCEGIELTFSAYVANVMTWGMYIGRPGMYACPRLLFRLTNPDNGAELVSYDTGDIPFDSTFINDQTCWQYSAEWHLVGMNFTVPVGVESVQLSIYNNVTNSNGNDFALDDIEIRLCMTPDTIRTDTTVCDTVQQIQWRGNTYPVAATLRDTLPSDCGFDSIYYTMSVHTEVCIPPCPELLTDTADTTVCDTLMPYRWRDTLFTEPARYEILYKNMRDCDSLLYILHLDTVHCRRPGPPPPPDSTGPSDPHGQDTLYPLIVNKYNWQLLLDNVTLRKLFPERTATAYQWYKNKEQIPGATEDDYAERNELHGRFQLRIGLDDNRTIWSNILVIGEEQTDQPVRVRIYDCHGMPVREDQLTHGIYLYRYEQGTTIWTEKRLIP